ncbi:MAG: putative outer membrane repeat protein, partial [Myxococcota bacterium]
NAIFSEVTFRDNTAGTLGGGLYSRGDVLEVDRCHFEDNDADAGGGLHVWSGILRSAVFGDNNPDDLSGGTVSYPELGPDPVSLDCVGPLGCE